MQIPTAMGRRMIKIPYNMPKKLKKGLKHCTSLTGKKIELFKDALVKKVNRIYYYRGVYKATQNTVNDNSVLNGAPIKTYPDVGIYGGSLGFGRVAEDYQQESHVFTNFALLGGNALAICLDIPTGYFLPQAFFSDVEDGVSVRPRRTFGITVSGQWDQKVLTALNNGEKNTSNGDPDVFLESADGANRINYQKIYTLSYRYTFTFKQNAGPEMCCWVITFKLGNSKPADFQNGLSNYISSQINLDPLGTHKRLVRGQMPPCFKVIKKKMVTVKDNVDVHNSHANVYGATQKMATISIKSNKQYISCATRPATNLSTEYINPNSAWYNENVHKYNYVMVYSVPKYLCDYQTDLVTTSANQVQRNTVQCIVEKESSYCVLSR